MNLDKAIEILNTLDHDKIIPVNPDLSDAIKLGNEALEWLNEARKEGCYRCPPQLPGEDSIEDKGLSHDRIQKVRESPLGKEPGA